MITVKATAAGFHGKLRQKGDVFEIESEAQLGTWMNPVTSTKAESSQSPDNTATDVLKLSIKKAASEINAIEDIDTLKTLDDAERAGQNRSGMLELIAARYLELDESEESAEEAEA